MNPIDAYAAEVVDGRIPAGKYHRLACVRHQRDRAREGTPGFPYRFDLRRAERFLAFGRLVKHYKGEWADQFVSFSPCQVFRLGSLFGWVRTDTGDERRRFRTAYNELPRKQGKSLEAAIVATYTTFFDGEPGAEGYCAATKRDQAQIVFRDAKKLVQSSGLKDRLVVQVANLHRDDTASKLEPLSADHNSMDGLNPHLVIVDEFHAHKDRGVIDVLETAMGARRQPVMFQITTAGDDPISPCGDQHDYACKVLEGVLVDESFFAFIAHADPEDNWLDERTWQKANPHWGVSVNPEDMRALATKAKNMPAAAAAFKQKRLNLWVNATAPCLSVDGWRTGQSDWTLDEMAGEPCYIGIDLASKIDLCVLSAVFPPRPGRARLRIWQAIWTPADTLEDRAHRDRAPYPVWVEQGWLRTTPGTRIDHTVIVETIRMLRGAGVDIEKVGYDPWHADLLIDQIAKDGLAEDQLIAVPQTYAGMSSACLRLQADILAGEVDARACPVTAWAVSNTVGQSDNKGNLMFTKGKSRGRIDPVIAPTIAVALWLREPARPAVGVEAEWLSFEDFDSV